MSDPVKKPAFSLLLKLPVGVTADRAAELYEEVEEFLANGCGVVPLLSSGVTHRTPRRVNRKSKATEASSCNSVA